MSKKLFVIIFLVFFPFLVRAQEVRFDKDGVYLKNYTREQLQKEFQELAYDEFLNPADNAYPRIFVENIPADLDNLENKTIRNQLFMQIVLPYALKINQEILEERKKLLSLQEKLKENHELDDASCAYVEDMAKTYDVVTPFKDSRRCMKLLSELINRVDAVPPSLLVSAAAVYTKWGTSRIAREANNLYKERDWYTDQGLAPINEAKDEDYRYKIYSDIGQSIQNYVHKINTNINFLQFRNARRLARKRGGFLYGKRLVWSFVIDNNLKNFAGILDYTITFYRLTFFDEAKLEDRYEFAD